jgi:quinol monooxygenase YgiN
VTNYYVYYRVDPARLEEVRARVARLFEAVARETGVRGRWMRRREDASTYMEVYEGVPDGTALESLMAREIADLGLDRRIERFVCA